MYSPSRARERATGDVGTNKFVIFLGAKRSSYHLFDSQTKIIRWPLKYCMCMEIKTVEIYLQKPNIDSVGSSRVFILQRITRISNEGKNNNLLMA